MENSKANGQDLLDGLHNEVLPDQPYFTRSKIRLLIVVLIGLAITNTFSAVNILSRFRQVMKELPSKRNMILTFSTINFIIIPITALIVSLIASLFPFKGLSYQKKLIPFSLIITLIFYLIEVGLFVFG